MKTLTNKEFKGERLAWEMNKADYAGLSQWWEIDLAYNVQGEYDLLDNLDIINIETFSLKTA